MPKLNAKSQDESNFSRIHFSWGNRSEIAKRTWSSVYVMDPEKSLVKERRPFTDASNHQIINRHAIMVYA